MGNCLSYRNNRTAPQTEMQETQEAENAQAQPLSSNRRTNANSLVPSTFSSSRGSCGTISPLPPENDVSGQHDSSQPSPPHLRRERSASLDLTRQRSRVTKNITATIPSEKGPTEHSMEDVKNF